MLQGEMAVNVNPLPSKRGVKRTADESIEQRVFTKRFNLLSLDQQANDNTNSNYYIPVSVPSAPSSNGTTQAPVIDSASAGADDSMHIDDTRDRVYIHNLDAELAEIAEHEPEQRIIFLPDIEKQFTRIPEQVLMGRRKSLDLNPEGQELVLYSVPKSLTVDESHDSVRRAIIDARQRARDKVVENARHEDMARKYGQSGDDDHVVETAHGYSNGYEEEQSEDPDAMELG